MSVIIRCSCSIDAVNVVLLGASNVRRKTANRDQTCDSSYSQRAQKKLARRRGEFLLEVGLQVLYSAFFICFSFLFTTCDEARFLW